MCSIRSNWIRPGLGARLRGSDLAGLQFRQKTRKLGTARLIAPALDPHCGLLLPSRLQFGPPSPWRTTRRYDWDKSRPSRNQISHYYATLTKPIVEHVTIPPALKPILHRPEPFPPPQSVIDGGKIVSSTLTVGNMTRTVHFYVPNESYLSRRKHGEIPLLIAFHGATEQGLLFRASSSSFAYDDLACKEAYIIAYPDAYKGNWNDGRVNVNYPAALEDIDDISFTKAVISHAQDTLGTDPNKTLMTGYSNGGQFILRMLFEETAPVIAGIAVHCVSLPEQENNKIKMINSNKSRIPIIFVNGVADPVNPYEGGKLILVRLANGKTLGDRGLHMGAQKTAKFLASNWKDAEYLDRTREVDRGVARRQEWRDNGRPVLRLISMEGEGHHVPVPGGSKMPLFLGPALEKLHAPQEVINFFKDATDALSLETTTPKDARLSISQHFKSINITLSLLSIVFATYLLT